ncbi:MAG: RsmD family RNA methyltransferase [Microbacterium sp.]
MPLGLEALSRGAAAADPPRRRRARHPSRSATLAPSPALAPPARVHRAAADTYLRGTSTAYDLVFIDPPYDPPEDTLTETLALLVPRLADGATVVVERATRSGEPSLPVGLALDRSKRYGDTTLWWLHSAD